ncbi:hypothetical protein QIW46_06965 [Pseudomonas fluorescens]|uniref:hypothetical protein n=1 Tax=Pseudomonas fluorescens TaxID=294 RepID=UPI003525F4AA
MNAPETIKKVSPPLRISRYGSHTSLSTAERIEVIDALTQMLGTTLGIQAHLDWLEQTLRNVSFLPVRELIRQLARTTADYAEFLITRIADLGGYAEPASLYLLNGATQSQCFADSLTNIYQCARRLQAADAGLRGQHQSAIANNDFSTKILFEECAKRNAKLLYRINKSLPHE